MNPVAINPLTATSEVSLFESLLCESPTSSKIFQFVGPLPSSIGSLKQLISLDLGTASIFGPIPRSLSDLKKLTKLNLMGNYVTGPLPSELGNLVQLKNLNLSHTILDDTIPDSFVNLINLEVLDMSSARLTGSIPSSFGNLVNLVELSLGSNKLSSKVPDMFGQMTKLQVLSMGNNHLEGPIPESLGRCMQLTTLHFEQNRFSGCIPESIFRLPLLEQLNFEHNLITSKRLPTCSAQSIRPEFGSDYTNDTVCSFSSDPFCLQSLNLTACQLEGFIDCLLLTNLDLSHNQLSGRLPNYIASSKNLQYLHLHENNLDDKEDAKQFGRNGESSRTADHNPASFQPRSRQNRVPVSVTSPQPGSFRDNRDPFPHSKLQHLHSFSSACSVGIEAFSGPSATLNIQKQERQVSECGSGASSMPVSRSQNKTIQGMKHSAASGKSHKFDVSDFCRGFRLAGPVPSAISWLKQLTSVNLELRHLSGPIPRGLSDLIQLACIDLVHTGLTGPIPSELGNLVNLKKLILSGPHFATIPVSLSQARLTGSIPESFPNCGAVGHAARHIRRNEQATNVGSNQ
ncbi:hypothetical protein BJ741DRAFT_670513 [Chytriomyces cf. hyalinus JEL632]|nr:hypothetical protein BJ741DRAFT_670513 [Chytriomyces cf. hyalinus JEL632]